MVFHKNRFIEVPKELANIYEAIVGAVYLDNDGNLEEVWRVFFPFMKSVIGRFLKIKMKFTLSNWTSQEKRVKFFFLRFFVESSDFTSKQIVKIELYKMELMKVPL